MNRREFIALVGGAAAWPIAARAQQSAKVYRIGILGLVQRPGEGVLRQALRDLGYVEGRNLVYEARYAGGQLERMPSLAAELVRLNPDVIITAGAPAAEAAKQATSTIPVVFWGAGDPIATGLVFNIAHPGGNMTGVTELSTELTAKRLQLFKEAIPTLARVAIIWNAGDRAMSRRFEEAEAAAPSVGVSLVTLPVRQADDFERAFEAMARDRPDGVFMVNDALTRLNEGALFEFLRANRLPSIFEFPPNARDGALMSYGPSLEELAPRAAAFVDKILKGAKPGDLPIEAPVRWQLVVNLKTARAIGVTIPPAILARADEVIE
jgi:putative tryptophan/tyrosine transport system substrate-binding protein